MWLIVLTVALLSCSSEGSVTCRDKNNGEVDWYIMYKAPRLKNKFTGLEYIYIDSNGAEKMEPSVHNYKPINHPNGVLANTLKPLFRSIRSMPPTFGFISYNDQAPGCSSATYGHSKGVVMVDKTDTGLWLVHSTPQFPFRRDGNHFWPPSGTIKAQTYMCVTFPYNQFKLIGKHLQYIGAYPFEHDIPGNFYKELIDATLSVQVTPPVHLEPLMSRGKHLFHSIAKQKSPVTAVGDLYVTISKLFGSELNAQTWGCQPGREGPYCAAGQYKVLNVMSLKTDLGEWKTEIDHSKWCVATDNNKPWTCIADVNRAPTQYNRGGGALCFNNQAVRLLFQHFIGDIQRCKRPHTRMDIMVDTSMCQPDPNSHNMHFSMG